MADELAPQVADIHLSASETRREESDDGNSSQDDRAFNGSEVVGSAGRKKKKKKKRKARPKAQPNVPAPESQEERAKWNEELRKGRPTFTAGPWGLLDASFKPKLDLILTPGCLSLSLETPRLILRPCCSGDLKALQRIKLEPLVQKTQLYGTPTATDIESSFLNRYVRAWDDYIFAITLRDRSSVTLKSGDDLRPSSRIATAEGYIGNIALHLKPSLTVRSYNTKLFPLPSKSFLYPTGDIAAASKLSGELFYEIHPQLWGNGIMSEAFSEMLRFAFEEVGVTKLVVDPTEGNAASIRLAIKNGFTYTHTARDNPYRKPQLFHSLTRDDWWARNRPKEELKGMWEGKEVCRWCMDFRLAPPTAACDGCKWAKYCSRECQRADWVLQGGHQSECGGKVV